MNAFGIVIGYIVTVMLNNLCHVSVMSVFHSATPPLKCVAWFEMCTPHSKVDVMQCSKNQLCDIAKEIAIRKSTLSNSKNTQLTARTAAVMTSYSAGIG